MSISVARTALDTLLEPASCHPASVSHVTSLHHYTTVAYATIGSPSAQQIALNAVPFIATQHPYLMHAVLAFSALHLRHLLRHSSQSTQYTMSSYHHLSRALSLFQSTLANSGNLNRGNMDALLSTCLLVDIISMSIDEDSFSASSAGPLLSLNWLAVQSGFKTLLTALDPHLHSSVWLPVFIDADDQHGTYLDERPGRTDLPPRLADLCAIGPDDTADTNPYHSPLRLLTPLLRLYACSPSSTREAIFTKLITFPARVRPDFRTLLADRDHRALLLMGCWFGMAAGMDQWWLQGRARREGWAVYEFLRRNAGVEISRLVTWVGRACQDRDLRAGGVGDSDGLDEWLPGYQSSTIRSN